MRTYTVDVTDYDGYKSKQMNIVELMTFYANEIDKREYPVFEVWFNDMKRCGLVA